MKINIAKIERTIGGLKFAVTLISTFTLCMIIGTFLESYYGTDFAGRVIYKHPFFMILQAFTFLCIYFAMINRFPYKKRLSGFYIIHTGLITLGCGSFITWYAGIDGLLTLSPRTPNREVILSDDIVKITYRDLNKTATKKLPNAAFSTEINETYRDIKLKTFLPFAKAKEAWKAAPSSDATSAKYNLTNEQFSQDFTLSSHPQAYNAKASLSLGPLSIYYLPQGLAQCFKKKSKSGFIVWDENKKVCFTPEQQKITIKTTSSKNRFFVVKEGDQLFSFFPDFSPLPLGKDLKVLQNSHLKVFSKNIYTKKPILLIFGKEASFYDKRVKRWAHIQIADRKAHPLPWMGFKLSLLRFEQNKFPGLTPEYVLPIQKNGQMIEGSLRALEVEAEGKSYWVTAQRPLFLDIKGQAVMVSLQRETLTLPFELTLTRFKMDKNPGTQMAASYESFVQIFKGTSSEKAHIYMNNPLKVDTFTFYQASYAQNQKTGQYNSTLSVNVDQGRFLKYLGSLLLVLGSLLHYQLIRKRDR